MKIKIIKCISFICILMVLLVLLSMLFEPKNNSVKAGMHNRGASGILAEPDNTIDMVVVGNSEAYTSIIPMELWNNYGYTSYVCASPEQPLPLSVRLVGEAVKKQKPKIVMLEASNINIRYDLSDGTDQILNYGLKVFQYHDRWKELKKEDFTTRPEYTTENYMKGYEFSDKIRGLKKQPTREKKMESVAIPRSNQIYLKAIKKICDQVGAKFILISIPSIEYWSHDTHDELQRFCDKNGIEFLDLNMNKEEIGIDWTKDTSDNGGHLNYRGALKTTTAIGKYLNENNLLDNHKDDDKYSHWNEQCEKYKRRVKNKL